MFFLLLYSPIKHISTVSHFFSFFFFDVWAASYSGPAGAGKGVEFLKPQYSWAPELYGPSHDGPDDIWFNRGSLKVWGCSLKIGWPQQWKGRILILLNMARHLVHTVVNYAEIVWVLAKIKIVRDYLPRTSRIQKRWVFEKISFWSWSFVL